MTRLRLASFNLLSGRSLADGQIDASRLAEATRLLDADVLAVQEVDRNQPRSGSVDQTALIARTMSAVDHRFVATVDGTPGVSWVPTVSGSEIPEVSGVLEVPGAPEAPEVLDGAGNPVAQFGVGLISRLPVAQWHVLRLRPARGTFPLPIASRPPQVLWLDDEPRVAVAAVLAEPRLTVVSTHLSFVPFSTLRQLAAVRRWLAELPGPQLLMGDLNLPGPLARRATGLTPLVSSPTFPSPAPRIQLDHVLAANLPRALVPWAGSSGCRSATTEP